MNSENKPELTAPSSSEIPESVYDGSEPFFAFFTQAQIGLATTRLSLEERIVSPTSDLGSQIETVRRTFQHTGNLPNAIQDVLRIRSQLEQRIQSWERAAQNFERAKSVKSGSVIQRVKAEISNVRVKAQLIQRTISKLEIVLQQMDAEPDSGAELSPAKTIESRRESLLDLFKTSKVTNLELRWIDADRMASGSPDWREQAWDHENLLLVAGWAAKDALPIQLKVWLVPKTSHIAHCLRENAGCQLGFVSCPASEFRCDLQWKLIESGDPLGPYSDSIRSFLLRIVKKRFAGIKSEFQMLMAVVDLPTVEAECLKLTF